MTDLDSTSRSSPSRVTHGTQLTYWPFRVVTTIAAGLLFGQAISAGQFLAGNHGALHTHLAIATTAGITVLVAAVAAIPIRRGGGHWWPIAACVVLLGLIALQSHLGFTKTLVVHVPLGVSIIALAIALAVWAWWPHPSTDDPRR